MYRPLLTITAVSVSAMLAGCMSGKYKPVESLAQLDVQFKDAAWDGKNIPDGQQCGRFGGKGKTPTLQISNIPPRTNALIFEYSDANVAKMDNGGHGKIGYRIKSGTSSITVPSVNGHTFDLPDPFFLVSAHNNPAWDTAGAYMPPCSGGSGNKYYVTVKAVLDLPEGQESQLFGQAKHVLGRY